MEPIEIHVRLSPDDEVLALRARVAELEAQAEAARAERDRLEYKYRCESLINTELIDLCKREGVPFREALTRRPSGPGAPGRLHASPGNCRAPVNREGAAGPT